MQHPIEEYLIAAALIIVLALLATQLDFKPVTSQLDKVTLWSRGA